MLLLLMVDDGFAKAKSHVRAAKSHSKLSTDIDFADKVVGGKYQYSNESITTVENDKSLDDLIGVRKNFADRVKRSESRW